MILEKIASRILIGFRIVSASLVEENSTVLQSSQFSPNCQKLFSNDVTPNLIYSEPWVVAIMDFLTRRILTYVGVFLVAINLDFILPRLVPGNAAEVLASSTKAPQAALILIENRLGINEPIWGQYVTYMHNIFLTWPPYFGVSFQYYPSTVSYEFGVRIGWTLILILSSLVIGVALAYFVARYGAVRRGGKFEFGALYSSIILNSTPIFWVAMVILWVLGVYLKLFPVFGNVGFNPGTGIDYIGSVIWHAILPVLVLSLSLFGESYLLLRGSYQEVLKTDYVLAAKTRGLRDSITSSRYILRNSLLPLVSVLAFSFASLISRVVLVEAVFGYPGVGDLIIDAVRGRDYPILEGSLFYLTVLVIVGGLIGDVLLTRLDPRIRK